MKIKIVNKKLSFLLRLGFSIVIICYLIILIDFNRFLHVLSRLDYIFAWQAPFFLVLTYLAVAIRWSYLLAHFKINQRIWESWRYYMIGGFYSIVLPGVIGGDVTRLIYSSKKNSNSKTILASTIIFERSCGMLSILLMASFSAIVFPFFLLEELVIRKIILTTTFIFLSIFLIFFLLLKRSYENRREQENSLNKFKGRLLKLITYYKELPIYLIVLCFGLTFSSHLFDIVGCYFLNKALHINQPFSTFLFIMPLVYVSTTLPISVGGIGVREGVLTFFLLKVGIIASDAIVLSLVIYFNRIIIGLVGVTLQFADNESSIFSQ